MKVLQRLPEGWKKTTLGKVAKFGSGTANRMTCQKEIALAGILYMGETEL